jgi:ABC-2 type transport system permease protein
MQAKLLIHCADRVMQGGFLRAYIQLAKLRLLTSLAYRFDVYASIGMNLILMLATVFLWRTAYRGIDRVAGVNEGQMVTYAVVSMLLGSIFVTNVQNYINDRVRRGEIAIDFLRPVRPLLAWLADDIGSGVGALLLQLIPLLLVSSVLVRAPLPANALAALLFVPCCLLSFGILWLVAALSGLAAFWTMELGHMGVVKDAVVRILSGSFVPIWFFPPWAQKVSAFLPFQYTYQLPLAIYVGRAGPAAAVRGMAVQVLWIVLLGLVVAGVWSRGSRRVIVQGG